MLQGPTQVPGLASKGAETLQKTPVSSDKTELDTLFAQLDETMQAEAAIPEPEVIEPSVPLADFFDNNQSFTEADLESVSNMNFVTSEQLDVPEGSAVFIGAGTTIDLPGGPLRARRLATQFISTAGIYGDIPTANDFDIDIVNTRVTLNRDIVLGRGSIPEGVQVNGPVAFFQSYSPQAPSSPQTMPSDSFQSQIPSNPTVDQLENALTNLEISNAISPSPDNNRQLANLYNQNNEPVLALQNLSDYIATIDTATQADYLVTIQPILDQFRESALQRILQVIQEADQSGLISWEDIFSVLNLPEPSFNQDQTLSSESTEQFTQAIFDNIPLMVDLYIELA